MWYYNLLRHISFPHLILVPAEEATGTEYGLWFDTMIVYLVYVVLSCRQYPSSLRSRVIWMLLPGPIRCDVSHLPLTATTTTVRCCHSIMAPAAATGFYIQAQVPEQIPSLFGTTTTTRIILAVTTGCYCAQAITHPQNRNPALLPPPVSHCWILLIRFLFSFHSVKRQPFVCAAFLETLLSAISSTTTEEEEVVVVAGGTNALPLPLFYYSPSPCHTILLIGGGISLP